MSLATNVTNLATRVATEVKAIRTLVNGNAADLSALDTATKTSLVAALNELKGDLGSLSTAVSNYNTANDSDISALYGDISTINGTLADLDSSISSLNTALNTLDVSGQVQALINDTATATDSVWSSSKTDSAISAAVAAVVDMAPSALDTLNELAAALGDDANYASTITTALSGKADATHSHAISDVTGLQTALDAKATTSSVSTLSTTVSNLSTAVGDTTTNFVTTFEAGLV